MQFGTRRSVRRQVFHQRGCCVTFGSRFSVTYFFHRDTFADRFPPSSSDSRLPLFRLNFQFGRFRSAGSDREPNSPLRPLPVLRAPNLTLSLLLLRLFFPRRKFVAQCCPSPKRYEGTIVMRSCLPNPEVEPSLVLVIHSLFLVSMVTNCLSTHILGIIAAEADLERERSRPMPHTAPHLHLGVVRIPQFPPRSGPVRARFLRSCSNQPRPEPVSGSRSATRGSASQPRSGPNHGSMEE